MSTLLYVDFPYAGPWGADMRPPCASWPNPSPWSRA